MTPLHLDLRGLINAQWRRHHIEELLLRLDCKRPVDEIASDMGRTRDSIIHEIGILGKAGLLWRQDRSVTSTRLSGKAVT